MSRDYQGKTLRVPVFGPIPLKPAEIWADMKLREESPLWAQFTKYILLGFSALFIFIGTFMLVEFVWPEFLDRSLMKHSTHQWHMSIVLALAFIPSNLFSYFTNRSLVFTPGKHSLSREFTLFMLISLISFVGGELGKRWIIEMGLPNIVAAISFAVSSAMINFVARKIIVFEN